MTEYRIISGVKKRTFRIDVFARESSDNAVTIIRGDDIRITQNGDTRVTWGGDTRVIGNVTESAYPPKISVSKRSFRILAKVNNG